MATTEIEGWVLDYACKHKLHEVIAALVQRHGEDLSSLAIPHARLSTATIHRIIHCRELEDFETAIHLTEQLYQTLGEACPFTIYFRLTYGLKMKVLFDYLKKDSQSPRVLNLMLNRYFPRCSSADLNTTQRNMSRLQTRVSNFRKFFLSLCLNENQRKSFLRDEYDTEFGEEFLSSLEKHVDRFLQEVEKCLPLTVLDKILQKGVESVCRSVPSMSVSMDILLECLLNKSRLHALDLLDLLTLIHPMSTQDQIRPCLQLSLCSEESFHDSQEGGDLPDCHISDLKAGTERSIETRMKVVDLTVPELSQAVTASAESVSVLSKKRPGVLQSRACTAADPLADPSADPLADLNPSQVCIISSSSDSTTQGSQVTGQVMEAMDVCRASSASIANHHLRGPAGDSDIQLWTDNSLEESANADSSLSDICASEIIPSSNTDEIEALRCSSAVSYPSLGRHQKSCSVKLCVVKLYRNKRMDVTQQGARLTMYS
ncbi:uncharacterized protein LOC124119200 isoform X1 [Haliotis rufescens]|uniref:uncharacterized protein LOC124119200 isoform X1 n=1 Tax=Haliotis rufescens TaxID=6454 RepID=UPI00201F25D1|nr:uncharacterized protein LOC124119200 isoform X1 [Haliotis rufescens]XP_048254779.1 uncharacterized protein LOC124119200 isoform X1 [Haliotis rufescens]XP_048254780.1 uncharacterized protein LOC124119200 isoform X1 [Haliotis rufescens]XP_048254781.1 uncharacterized protein LOC124119200 isoform X1 [Haliotis rufescens]XP_048254782.1 uncharacterized protein LOC124119200 isoform X1 [Haliotis rufescens]XP_048254783.1 uncharacterized protein LOC124119200 isoform X1 [Haliotis rufescens]XP_04825478